MGEEILVPSAEDNTLPLLTETSNKNRGVTLTALLQAKAASLIRMQ